MPAGQPILDDLNGLAERVRFERADVFDALATVEQKRERYDIVIADPPSFVKSKKDLGPGARAYRKLARLSSGAVENGGFLFIASCSHNMTPDLFAGEIAAGLAAAARTGRIVMSGGAGPDRMHTAGSGRAAGAACSDAADCRADSSRASRHGSTRSAGRSRSP